MIGACRRKRRCVRECDAISVDVEWCGNGKPPGSRRSYFKALLAKAFWNFPSTAALIGELAAQCDVGVKRNSKGFKESWRGYKLHVAASDGDIPVAMWLTSASLHDSQAAIPVLRLR